GGRLGQAIDDGEPLRDDLWHPLRPPVIVSPSAVTARLEGLESALRAALTEAGMTEESDDWSVQEIGEVMAVYREAARRGEAVVSALTPPIDAERAARVLMPLLGTQ